MNHKPNRSDTQLVSASLAGDREAFSAIVHRYQGIVTGLIYNRCHGNVARSEELAQDTFVAAWTKLETLQESEKLAAWLCGIARNVANAAARDRSRSIATTRISEEATALATNHNDPAAKAIEQERDAVVWQALEQLPDLYREPMILYYRQQQSAADVAVALEISDAVVRKRLERGRAILREQMASLVEETLENTAPRHNFSAGVLAALPAYGGAKVGGGSLVGAATAKCLATATFWIGPVLAVVTSLTATQKAVRAARNAEEKRLIKRRTAAIYAVVLASIALQYGLLAFKEAMSRDVYIGLISVVWIGAALGTTAAARYYHHRQLRLSESLDETSAESLDGPQPHTAGTNSTAALEDTSDARIKQVALSMGIGLVAGTSWMVLLAVNAADWLSTVGIVATCVALYWWGVRTTAKSGPQAAPRAIRTMLVCVFVLFAIVVNFRLHDWLVVGAGKPFGFPMGEDVPDFPFFSTNVLVLAIGISMLLPAFVSPRSATNAVTDSEARPGRDPSLGSRV